MDINDYVLGISEMPYYWGLPSGGTDGSGALEAQAIAARSYAANRTVVPGAPSERPNCWCHIVDTSADQRYVGWGHSGLGQQAWLDAVRATAGKVLLHPDETKNGEPVPIAAFYSSSTFGSTEPGKLIFGTAEAYLVSVHDSRAHQPSVGNPNSRWQKTVTSRDLARTLGWLGDRRVVRVDIVECSPSGAAQRIVFLDGGGAQAPRSIDQFRGLLGLKSPQVLSVDGATPCGGAPAAPGSIAPVGLWIDDDATGDSVGNGDGAAQCGETVELRTGVNNRLDTPLTGSGGTLTIDDAYARIVHNTDSSFPAIAAGGTELNDDDWDVAIVAETPARHRVALRLELEDPATTLAWQLPVTCADPDGAPVKVARAIIDDDSASDSSGNGDGLAGCGEVVELSIRIRNSSGAALQGVAASLAVRAGGTLLYNTESSYGDLGPAGSSVNTEDFDVAVDAVVAAEAKLRAWLTVETDSAGPWRLPITVPIDCEEAGAQLAVGSVIIDDGANGDSRGNFDRTAQCGETIELYVPLTAETELGDVSGTLPLRDDPPQHAFGLSRSRATAFR